MDEVVKEETSPLRRDARVAGPARTPNLEGVEVKIDADENGYGILNRIY